MKIKTFSVKGTISFLVYNTRWSSFRLLGFILLTFSLPIASYSQSPDLLQKKVTLQLSDLPISDVLSALEEQTGASFSYSNTNLGTDRRVSVDFKAISLKNALVQLLGGSVGAVQTKGNVINLQANARLSGTVTTEDGSPAAYAHVTSGSASTLCDEQGRFSFESLPVGKNTITATFVGYEPEIKDVEIAAGQTAALLINLKPAKALSEVVVTASRRIESISEVPSSVTILSAKVIEEQMNINSSIADVLGNAVPGLGTSTNGATNSGQTLRGRNVLVLIDGIPQSTPLMNGYRDIRTIDPSIIERVEVIKGATSIYGNGSGGGIINYITRQPRTNRKIAGNTTLTSNLHPFHPANTLGYRVSQTLHGTLKKFSYVVGGTYSNTGVFKDGKGNVLAQNDGISQVRLFNFFGKLNYKLNESSDLTASYKLFSSLQRTDYINEPGVYNERPSVGVKGDNPGEPAGTPYNHNAYVTYRNRALPFKTSLELNGYLSSFASMNRYIEHSPAFGGPGQTQIISNKKGLRLNLVTPWKVGNGLNGDVFYGLDLLNDVTNQPLTDGRVHVPKMDMINMAPYIQVKAHLFEHLVFKGGVRYENVSVKVKDYRTIATGLDGEGSIAVQGGTILNNATVFNAGLRFTKFDIFNPFVSYSQAFGLNELGRVLRSARENTISKLRTDAIIVDNYEAGFSSRTGKLQWTAAYYISKSELGVNLVDNGNGDMVPQRAPERIKGFEVTLDAYLTPGLTVGGNYSYVEGKAQLEDGTELYLSGARITPPKATGYITYQVKDGFKISLFWVNTGSRNRFQPRANGRYGGGEGPVKPVNLFNLNASYRISRSLRASLGVENLFNNAYYPNYSQYRALDLQYTMGNGAKTNLTLNYSF